ncbi:hypothetical protein M408DRAFT_280752 [Serendipita vermifera MAFF 305830]|uniref:Uncharacterized protein n=1 Tax=Serendipita vermifera MAFF 305830 TaxID=933852 RepID=A0A0C3ATX6_SERVB|nr:hypothetical protein M408DRAFT_280752 [Serendipita vermifera MAFF 305830]
MSAMENDRILYLEEIHVENDTTKQLGVTLQVDSHDIRMERDKQSLIWKLLHNHNLTSASKIAVIIKAKRRIIDGSSFRTRQARVDVSGLEMIEAFWESRTPAIATTFDNLPATVNFKLRPSPTLEIAYEYIIKAQEILTTYRPLMQGPTEQGTNKPIKYGVTLAEVNPMVKTAFSLVKVTFDMSKEQNKYDESVYDLATSIERILPFADRILEDELCDEAEKVEPVIKTLCSLVMETATFICDHVKKSIIERRSGISGYDSKSWKRISTAQYLQ